MAKSICLAAAVVEEGGGALSLLDEAMEECVMLDKKTVTDDDYGGFVVEYVEGATFSAAVVLDDSIQAQTALSQGVKGVYTVTTARSVNLQFRDIFKRKRDNKIFRVTTDGDDKKTPDSAGLDMRQVRAEEWSLT